MSHLKFDKDSLTLLSGSQTRDMSQFNNQLDTMEVTSYKNQKNDTRINIMSDISDIQDITKIIIMDNDFEKGHLVFKMNDFLSPNVHYVENIDLIKDMLIHIRIAKEINIVLSELCLPSVIFEELNWLSNYISIKCIFKNNDIASFYQSRIDKMNITFDSNVEFNYLSTSTKNYLIEDGNFYVVEYNLEKILTINDNVCNFKDIIVPTDHIIDVDNSFLASNIQTYALNNNISYSYVMDFRHYNKLVYDKVVSNNINLYTTCKVIRGLFLIDSKNDLYILKQLKKNKYIKLLLSGKEIWKYILGNTYQLLKLPTKIDYDKLSNILNIVENGEVTKINVQPLLELAYERKIDDFDDFIDQKYDFSIVNKHNIYCDSYRKVKYTFTLIPPLVETNEYSSIYKPMISLNKKLQAHFSSLDLLNLADQLNILSAKNDSFLNLGKSIRNYTNSINMAVTKYQYRNFYQLVTDFKLLLTTVIGSEIDLFMIAYDSLATENDDNRITKIEKEIEERKFVIDDKLKLISQGIETIKNKQRISREQEEIEMLIKLRNKFMTETSSRIDVNRIEFRDNLLNIQINIKNDESLRKVIIQSEISKEQKVHQLIRYNYPLFTNYIAIYDEIVTKILQTDIPEDFKIYEQKGIKYLAISYYKDCEKAKEYSIKYNSKIAVFR